MLEQTTPPLLLLCRRALASIVKKLPNRIPLHAAGHASSSYINFRLRLAVKL